MLCEPVSHCGQCCFSLIPVSTRASRHSGDTDGWSPPGPLLKLHVVHGMGEVVDASVRADS